LTDGLDGATINAVENIPPTEDPGSMNAEQASSNLDRSAFLKPFWTRTFGPPWAVSLLLMALLGGVRYVAVFSPFPAQAIFFLQYAAAWAIPFVVLTTNGRYQIGLYQRGANAANVALGMLAGAVYGLITFGLGMVLYGDSPENWCVTLRDYLRLIELRGVLHPAAVFALFALPAIIFAPIADEILFRGFIQTAFTRRWNSYVATAVNCLGFGATYLYFHAIWTDAAGMHIRLVSGGITLLLFTGAGLLFTLMRLYSGTLWTAVAAHAGFNLTLLGAAIFIYMR
jgi:membrane protease YdiL (CAAX protease family)